MSAHTPNVGLKLVGHLLRTALALSLAAGFWWLAQGDMWMFNIYAVICLLGALQPLGSAVLELIGIIGKRRANKRYGEKGSEQKSDRMAQADDLRRKGLTK